MTFWGKVGSKFKALGSKVAGAASFLGNKVGNALLTISPVATLINPAIGARLAGAGAVAKGIGALGDFGKSLLAGTATVHDARQGGRGSKPSYKAREPCETRTWRINRAGRP